MAEKDLNAISRYAERHLLRRKADLEIAAENGQGGQLRPAAGGLRKAPRRDRRPDRTSGEDLRALGKPARGKKCDAIEGILDEGKEIMDEYADTPALDAGLLAAAQAVEHYEISRYGTLKAGPPNSACSRRSSCSTRPR